MKIWDYKSSDIDKLAIQTEKNNTIAFTKPEMAKHLLSYIDFNDSDIVMEPCFGDGAFYNNIPVENKQYCEINMGIDYLQFNGKVDITLSNPPFVPRKLFWDFHRKAMATTNREIRWLINMLSLNVFTPNRLEEMNNNGRYINNMYITGDKRRFGRYVRVKFTKTDNGFIGFNKTIF